MASGACLWILGTESCFTFTRSIEQLSKEVIPCSILILQAFAALASERMKSSYRARGLDTFRVRNTAE
jgi:hypothetical protein